MNTANSPSAYTSDTPHVPYSFRGLILLGLCFLCRASLPAAEQPDPLAVFSDPARIWGRGAERVIEEAYRLCFKTRIIGGKVMILRMPFAQNNERDKLTAKDWGFLGGGKANPEFLWETIEKVLDGAYFKKYTQALQDGREKVLILDIPSQTWSITRELFDLARMKAGSYRGLLHRPYILVSGKGVEDTDVYNYLYCIARTGMDCSGFVWHILSYTAAAGGLDLGKILSREVNTPAGGDPSYYIGTWLFNSRSSQITGVKDEIRSLQPADILLFRAADGGMAHSAIIQSIDFSRGVIRYLQCTDEAPPEERGVHESSIYFDPRRPELSLKDPSLRWTQQRYPPFAGENPSPFSDDGLRFRAYPELGGGRVVRFKAVTEAIARLK
ncbi:MAG: peptidoglycan endopeptidase [Treponema sp.]|nr:peptidoglycan endopeptidase [Treponema sp.]